MISFSSSSYYDEMTLRLFGDNLDPTLVSSILGIKATSSFNKGDSYSQGMEFRKNSMWELKLHEKNKEIESNLDFIMSLLPREFDTFLDIPGVTFGRLSIWFSRFSSRKTFELQFDTIHLTSLAKSGLQFKVTYFSDDEPELHRTV